MNEKSEYEAPYRIESGISYIGFIETKFFIEGKGQKFWKCIEK